MRETENRNIFEIQKRYKFITSPHKLDDYDSTILEDRAYLDLDDSAFRLEYQINMLENNISLINDEISGAKSIDDSIRLQILHRKKTRMGRELKLLMFEYGRLNLVSKVIGWITFYFKNKRRKKVSFGDFMLKNVWSKISKKMNMVYSLKLSLAKLANINRSVDELIQMQAPTKDAKDRYERLTTYINKANTIHSEIYKNIKL